MNVQLPPNDAIRSESLPKGQFLLEFLPDILGKNLVLLQAVDHFLVERA